VSLTKLLLGKDSAIFMLTDILNYSTNRKLMKIFDNKSCFRLKIFEGLILSKHIAVFCRLWNEDSNIHLCYCISSVFLHSSASASDKYFCHKKPKLSCNVSSKETLFSATYRCHTKELRPVVKTLYERICVWWKAGHTSTGKPRMWNFLNSGQTTRM